MKKNINSIKENYKVILVTLIIGFVMGWLFFQPTVGSSVSAQKDEIHEGHDHTKEAHTIWTCSMHPQIKQDEPGLCPICAMDLIPLTTSKSGGSNVDPNEIVITESAAKLADIQTDMVSIGVPEKVIYMQGKVQTDERRISELSARFGGRIEKLFVNFTGQTVRKGEKLATIYSPELVTAQRELLEAMASKDIRPSLYAASRNKLKLWNLSIKQIDDIEKKGEPITYFEVYSPISGTVTMRHVSIGDYVKEGMPLFEVIDLTRLWVMFDAYEIDLPWIKTGDKMDFTINALPGKNFTSNVTYIDPIINAKTRVAKVRVELSNENNKLKPEMFANGVLKSRFAENKNEILIPRTSVLWTGKRAVVYVKVTERDSPTFLYREIVLGPEAGNFYVVKSGLKEGEVIAVNGVFKIDAAAQLTGLSSMMNPNGESVSTGHQHGNMDMTENNELIENPDHNFTVYGNCSMCKERIENAAILVKGVQNAHWNENTKLLSIEADSEIDIHGLHNKIASVGHDTDMEIASNEVYNNLHECCKYTRPSDLTHQSFVVHGNCDMCKERIEGAALNLDGVSKALWDMESGILEVSFNNEEVTLSDIHSEIASVGHDTELKRASDDVYNQLHECCKYERINN
jgi:membrane fusion protein, copper/silver efflux system